jgi:hypothetical protein
MTEKNTKKLQELTDIIESRILYAAGDIKLASTLLSTNSVKQSAENHLGDAISALLELKKELGLHTNLAKEEARQ